MKKRYLPIFIRLMGVILMAFILYNNSFAYPNGSPAGYTGSPGDNNQKCASCHGGSTTTVAGWITSNIPSEGYTAGTSYTITATVSGSGKKGFEVSPQNITGTQLGVLAAGSGSKLVGGTKYVTQSSAGSSSGTKVWNFTWTAPAAGTGPVTLYGAFILGYSSTKLSTLVINEANANALAATAIAIPEVICLGESSQLSAAPTGGSGTYTYLWTSIPAGFTSTLQNPVVTPDVSTQYTVNVNDGAQSVEASTTVTVNQPATAFAGNDMTYPYETTEIILSGTATNYASVSWSTSGTGTFSGNTLSASYFPSMTDLDAQIVTLTLTAVAISPCSTDAVDQVTITFALPNGIKDNKDVEMTVSPNPSQGRFNISIDVNQNNDAGLAIYDLTGRIILEKTISSTSNSPEQINLTGYPKGIYFVKAITDKGTVVKRLILD